MSKHVLCHPYTNKVIAESQEGETLNVFIERLIKEEANLGGANLEKANLGGANLIGANLIGANLEEANLRGANLRGANLIVANLRGADLGRANLEEANLRGANLEEANLRGANLGGANLEKANLGGANLFSVRGNNKQIKSLHIFEEYDVAYTKEFLQIGCENHAIEDWKSFDNQRILKMDGKKALSFWRKYKELIFSTIETSPAT